MGEGFAPETKPRFSRTRKTRLIRSTLPTRRKGRSKPCVRSSRVLAQALTVCLALSFAGAAVPGAKAATSAGLASWYGEEHRGKLMANGQRFDPDKYTAASWYYPLGTKVCVSLVSGPAWPRSVLVTITDRGPAMELVRDGRIIDLSHAPFKRLAPPGLGLVAVAVRVVR
jgi:rare lipoprotein A